MDYIKKHIKSPLGLRSKKIWLEFRIEEIKGAIARYMKVSEAIPRKWIEEYNNLVSYIKGE